jgi:hypothetical protein
VLEELAAAARAQAVDLVEIAGDALAQPAVVADGEAVRLVAGARQQAPRRAALTQRQG